jgi:hypothetical protein
MYIIFKNDYLLDKKTVVSVLYDFQYERWINNYLNNEKNYLENCGKTETDSETRNIEYTVNNRELIQTETIVKKGYLYNNIITKETKILSLEVYTFDANDVESNYNNESTRLWENINSEINKRILKNMDKESLYQVFMKINENMKLKQNWSNYEYINMLNEILKNFKKELYSSVAKKLKRFRRSH